VQAPRVPPSTSAPAQPPSMDPSMAAIANWKPRGGGGSSGGGGGGGGRKDWSAVPGLGDKEAAYACRLESLYLAHAPQKVSQIPAMLARYRGQVRSFTTQRALSVTQRAVSVTQRAVSVTQRALSVTQRALSATQRAVSVTQRALSVTQRAVSVTQRALSATQRAVSVTQRALSVTQRALSVTQRALSVTHEAHHLLAPFEPLELPAPPYRPPPSSPLASTMRLARRPDLRALAPTPPLSSPATGGAAAQQRTGQVWAQR
jgi:ActR/RegA family two-component response regulator